MVEQTLTRLHAVIEGHVQGVGFRAFVFDVAQSMEATGWVRNTFEGNVEVLAEGLRENLEILLDYMRRGPRSAFVTHIAPTWSEPTGEFERFEVRRTT